MGAGASIGSVSDESLIENFITLYTNNPGRIDALILEAKRRVQMSKDNKCASIPVVCEDDDTKLFSQEMTEYLNFVRNNPKIFVEKYLKPHLESFIDEFIYQEKNKDGSVVRIQTNEGKRAVNEAIQYCMNMSTKFPPMVSNEALVKAAVDHCKDLNNNNRCEHDVRYTITYVSASITYCSIFVFHIRP